MENITLCELDILCNLPKYVGHFCINCVLLQCETIENV